LLTYQHPTEKRQFFAPDVEPTVDETVPIIFITGLNNFSKPHPSAHRRNAPPDPASGGTAPNGSSFMGQDFRNAYASDVPDTGAGQMVGLVEFEGYFSSDMTAYENAAGISTSFPIQNVPLPDWGGISATDTNGIQECSLDIEMVMSMAPGLSQLYVFEGASEGGDADTMLKYMSSSNQIKQFSSSWAMTQDPMADGYLMKMAMQGQSFMMDAGDGDAYVVAPGGDWPTDDPYVTSCGGTTLTLSNGVYISETVWNWHLNGPNPWCCNGQTTNDPYWGSAGGVSANYSIPLWQQNVNTTAVGGSSTMRNLPDVAMTADQVWVYAAHTFFSDVGGTSVAAPLWAGFTALANEHAASQGLTPLGFLNPALYAIGEGPLYGSAFHDVTNGNNFWPKSPSKFNSAAGYDLCTGWGTPNGMGLINALMSYGSAVWVDFNYNGSTQNGTYDNPYATMSQAISAVPTGGNIWIRTAGSTSATMTISKRMTIHAYDGQGTIGN
jgi:subtilase family serine protease